VASLLQNIAIADLINLLWISQDSHLTLHNAAEVVGKVQNDLSIRVFQATDFGDKIGM